MINDRLINLANYLDYEGFKREADQIDLFISKYSWEFGDPVQLPSVNIDIPSAPDWVNDATSWVAEEVIDSATAPYTFGYDNMVKSYEHGKDLYEAADYLYSSTPGEIWGDLEGKVEQKKVEIERKLSDMQQQAEEMAEQAGEVVFNKANDWSRDYFSEVLGKTPEQLFRWLIRSIPGAMGAHEVPGSSEGLVWDQSGIRICDIGLIRIATAMTELNQLEKELIGLPPGVNPLNNAFVKIHETIHYYPIILSAVSLVDKYDDWMQYFKRVGYSFEYESKLWSALMEGVVTPSLSNGSTNIAEEVGYYCNLVKLLSDDPIEFVEEQLVNYGVELDKYNVWKGLIIGAMV